MCRTGCVLRVWGTIRTIGTAVRHMERVCVGGGFMGHLTVREHMALVSALDATLAEKRWSWVVNESFFIQLLRINSIAS